MTKIDKSRNPRWPPAAILDFGFEPIIFERLELDTFKFGIRLDIHGEDMGKSKKLTKVEIRPPSWISV